MTLIKTASKRGVGKRGGEGLDDVQKSESSGACAGANLSSFSSVGRRESFLYSYTFKM